MEIWAKCMECHAYDNIINLNRYYDCHRRTCPRYWQIGYDTDWMSSPRPTGDDVQEMMYQILTQNWIHEEDED